jgi:hypothetical protein
MKIAIAFAVIAGWLCTSAHAGEILTSGPFAGVDLASLPKRQAEVLRSANEDFVLVEQGKRPRNAVEDEEMPLPSDGGTTFYKGKGYRLTILQSLSSFGDLSGFAYGPIITFDDDIAKGNTKTIQSVRFLTTKQLEELMKKANQAPEGTARKLAAPQR